MNRFAATLLWILLISVPSLPQAPEDAVTEARTAMTNGDYARAATILSAAVPSQPSADAYVYLGIAYAHTREWKKAEDALKEGSAKYPQDPRFHNELAGVYLAANDLERAHASLTQALAVDPANRYASDLRATVDMSMGNVREALASWNEDGRPVIGSVLHNNHVEFENWIVRRAATFRAGDQLTWGNWLTTEVRLRQSEIFGNSGLDIEPTTDPNRYTAVIHTVPKENSTSELAYLLMQTVVFKTPTLNWWNVGNSGVSLTSSYRFATNRHRAELGIRTPLPVPGVLFVDTRGIFRSERWDISRPANSSVTESRFRYQSNGFRTMVRHIPHYRFELAAGFEYRNRTIAGSEPRLLLDSRNTGKMLFEASVLPVDGRYRNRIHAEGFVARKSILGDLNYSGGTIEFNNRYLADSRRGINLDVTLKGGASRGQIPVDDYFVLGLSGRPDNLLRGHKASSSQGHYGHAPMGTSFVLVNTTFDRRMRRLPFFDVLNLPYVDLKYQLFVDAAKTFDRAHVFEQGKLLVDVGGGFKLETPTRVLNLTYGRSLRDGTGTLTFYIQRRW